MNEEVNTACQDLAAVENPAAVVVSASRYNLKIDAASALPAYLIFVLTIVSGLLALFVIAALHYNFYLLMRKRPPYQTCLPEIFFPSYFTATDMDVNNQMLHAQTKADELNSPNLHRKPDNQQGKGTPNSAMRSDSIKSDNTSSDGASDFKPGFKGMNMQLTSNFLKQYNGNGDGLTRSRS